MNKLKLLGNITLELKCILRDFVKRINNYSLNRYVAMPPRHSDLYVVSFPKSGATWMNFLMANIHLLMSKDEETKVTFYNVHDYIPDIHISNKLAEIPTVFPAFRVIKSHSKYNSAYKKVILLIRDPRDVMVSYYHFIVNQGLFDGSISEFIRSEKYGISNWVDHSSKWMDSTPLSTRFYLVKYEDMKADIKHVIKIIYTHCGYDLPEDVLSKAIERSSFDNMRKIEVEYNYGGRKHNMKFVREGKTKGFGNELSSSDQEHIKKVAGDMMQVFGYE